MNTALRTALLVLSAVASTPAAVADEADASQFAQPVVAVTSRAAVQAEARTVARNRSLEPAGSRVASPADAGVTRAEVSGRAAEAVRAGTSNPGEAGFEAA